MLAIFGIGITEIVILAAGLVCLGSIVGIIALVVALTNRKDE